MDFILATKDAMSRLELSANEIQHLHEVDDPHGFSSKLGKSMEYLDSARKVLEAMKAETDEKIRKMTV